METPAHDPGRFARAFERAYSGGVEQIGRREYRVLGSGRNDPYYDVNLDGDPACYCGDQDFAGKKIHGNCYHVLAAKTKAQCPEIIPSMMEYAYQRSKRAEEAERRTKRRKSA